MPACLDLQGRIQGFGSDIGGGGGGGVLAGGGAPSRGGGMVGFGSDSFHGAPGGGSRGGYSGSGGMLDSLASGVRELGDRAMSAMGQHRGSLLASEVRPPGPGGSRTMPWPGLACRAAQLRSIFGRRGDSHARQLGGHPP